ncbi:hypothetical protein [Pseudarthrobacter oxydans]|uniref:hypothetical protein n=1 Tax=Pseudarthrobacter oxydans TaxID=1671 RepID=UPI0038229E53
MTKYRHHEWARLIGAPVEVRKYGEVVRAGIVDAAMPDSSMIWIASDEQFTRTLFEAAQGFQVWVEPRRLEGTLTYRMTNKALHD